MMRFDVPDDKAVPGPGGDRAQPDEGGDAPASARGGEEADRRAQLPPRPVQKTWPDLPPLDIEIREARRDRRKPPAPTPPEMNAVRPEEMRVPSEMPPSSGSVMRESSLFPEGEHDTDISRLTDFGIPGNALVKRDRAILLRMDGADAGEVHALELDTVRIGRHPMTELTVRDDGVSRVHARIRREGTLWFVEDQGSTNGTLVQGERVEQAVLHDGDTLQIGPRVTFRYSLVDSRQEAVLRDLYESSRLDALTGVFNRKHFAERLDAELVSADRKQLPLSLIMFDLDHFKQVNDTFGHPAGDAVLKHVASLVKQRLRTSDILARVGGEEFAVLLRGADLQTAARVAERMRVSVATKPVFFGGQHIAVSISLGCAQREGPDETATSLVGTADRRLYAAKNGGRNRVASSG
jgi:two-component system cell cycle response regulator